VRNAEPGQFADDDAGGADLLEAEFGVGVDVMGGRVFRSAARIMLGCGARCKAIGREGGTRLRWPACGDRNSLP
jgi:hypothetical protein